MKLTQVTLLTFLCLLYSVTAHAVLYKWVDDKGNTHYTSAPPPESAVHDRELIGDQGRVIKTIQGRMTPEEKAAYERRLFEEEQAKKEKAEREKRDRGLLISYKTVEEIEEARDRKVNALEDYIESLEHSRNDAGSEYDDLLSQAILEERAGQAPSEKLKADLRSAKREFEDAEADLEKAKKERLNTVKRFGDDIVRFKELKGIKD